MTYFIVFGGVGLILGGLVVASSPSPYYGVVGLVLGSVSGCIWLLSLGFSFVSLVLFMVYLGGMLVVFVYSVALAADPFPEGGAGVWLGYGLSAVLVCMGLGWLGLDAGTVDSEGVFLMRLDFSGVSLFYSCGVGVFLMAGWGLLVSLFVVLELVRGLSRGAIRAI
uniref:NADH-ubiquinone oxidoreductase chain 6 n=1 Tax=Glaucidium brodiei brodiei TaxID=1664683 RepID=A0A141BHI1_9STRI|nr:NADH dehydrogenase subunit 6 [Glaucidium brodiei brodiei]